jgi:RNA polymerase sigma factor (sigma-70 family)
MPKLKQCTLSDEDLALLAQNGDEDANTELYYRYRQLVINVFGRIAKCNWADGEDIFQEAFPKAVLNFSRDKGSFKSFLLKIAHNKHIDIIRKAKPQREVSLDDPSRADMQIAALEPGPTHDPPSAKTPPDPALCQFLEPQQRKIYNLRYTMGKSWQYIADHIGYSSADSARKTMSKAIKLAKEKIGRKAN